jgi:hypothetical protein
VTGQSGLPGPAKQRGGSTGPAWTELSDVVAVLRRRWVAGPWLTSAAAGPAWEPFAVPLRGPTATQLANQFGEVRDWVSRWRTAEKRGLRLEFHSVGGRRVGTNKLPRRVWFDEPEQAYKLLNVQDQVDRFVQLVELERERAPRLVDWMLSHPHRVLAATAAWDLLVRTVLWIDTHAIEPGAVGNAGLYLRQIDVPGVDTKFIEAHGGLIGRLLEEQLDPSRVNQAAPRSEFAARYGFRSKPEYVRFRFLDVRNVPGAFSEMTVRTAELAHAALPVSRVYAVENEITYLAFPDVPDAAVFFGGGYAVSRLAPLHWLADMDLTYWGDLDTHGFAILNLLRRSFPHTRSMLMDRRTLLDHEGHWIQESEPNSERLDLLDPAEADLYQDLVEDSFGRSVRLEQERIRFSAIERELRKPQRRGSAEFLSMDGADETFEPKPPAIGLRVPDF